MLRWLFVLLVMTATTLSAPAKEPYGLGVIDELKQLDRVALEEAARPLLRRGAAVAVVLVRHGDERDAVKQLGQLGLLNGSQIQPAGIYLYISLDPHYSELRAGERFRHDLSPSRLEKIRDQTLNPRLREERYQQGLIESMADLELRLAHQLSLKQWLAGATVTVMVTWTLYLVGFWDWLVGTAPGRLLLWLWSWTPIARAQRRQELEQARQARLRSLQQQAESLERVQQSAKALSPLAKAELSRLQQQVKEAGRLDLLQLVELRTRVEAETRSLENLARVWSAGATELKMAHQLFGSVRSVLKERKKTRGLLQSQQVLDLDAELKQESELRKRYSEEGAGLEELEHSETRCRQLNRRAESLAETHGVIKKSAPQPQSNWSESEQSSSSSSYQSPSSTYEDRNTNYDPPSSSSESWAGGSW